MKTKQQWSSEKKHLHQAQVSRDVMEDVRAYKEYERSNGNNTNMSKITEDALMHYIRSHKDAMVSWYATQKHRLQRL